MHSAGISALEDRRRGILDALEPLNVRHETIITGIEPEKARTAIASCCTNKGSFVAVLCTGQADTQGAGLAAGDMPAECRPYVACFDVSDAIRDMIRANIITFSIDQQPYAQGFYPVAQPVLYLLHNIMPTDIDAGAIHRSRKSSRFPYKFTVNQAVGA